MTWLVSTSSHPGLGSGSFSCPHLPSHPFLIMFVFNKCSSKWKKKEKFFVQQCHIKSGGLFFFIFLMKMPGLSFACQVCTSVMIIYNKQSISHVKETDLLPKLLCFKSWVILVTDYFDYLGSLVFVVFVFFCSWAFNCPLISFKFTNKEWAPEILGLHF